MQRDYEYMRGLMLELEAENKWLHLVYSTKDSSGDDKKKFYHMKLLQDAGFLEGSPKETAFRITNSGHDFIAAIKDETVWKKTVDAAKKVGGLTLPMLKSVAESFLRQFLRDNGVPMA